MLEESDRKSGRFSHTEKNIRVAKMETIFKSSRQSIRFNASAARPDCKLASLHLYLYPVISGDQSTWKWRGMSVSVKMLIPAEHYLYIGLSLRRRIRLKVQPVLEMD